MYVGLASPTPSSDSIRHFMAQIAIDPENVLLLCKILDEKGGLWPTLPKLSSAPIVRF